MLLRLSGHRLRRRRVLGSGTSNELMQVVLNEHCQLQCGTNPDLNYQQLESIYASLLTN